MQVGRHHKMTTLVVRGGARVLLLDVDFPRWVYGKPRPCLVLIELDSIDIVVVANFHALCVEVYPGALFFNYEIPDIHFWTDLEVDPVRNRHADQSWLQLINRDNRHLFPRQLFGRGDGGGDGDQYDDDSGSESIHLYSSS